jgi:8-oxo-dGTP diphosphatase
MSYTYEYPRPAVTADVVLFGHRGGDLHVLLVERGHPPFAGCWALPGGFVDSDEPLEKAARRELAEETGLEVGPLEQLRAYGDPGRDPRGHVVTIAFVGLVEVDHHQPRAASDAARSAWFPVSALPPLAFDHDRIVADGIARVCERGAADVGAG